MFERKKTRRPSARRRPLGPAPRLESLECRTLLSGIDPAPGPQMWPGEVIVQFKEGTVPQAQERARFRAFGELEDALHTPAMQARGSGPIELLTIPAGRSVEATIRALEKNPHVAFAEPNWVVTTQVANDPYYTGGDLWGLDGDNNWGINAEDAWAIGATGSDPTKGDTEIVIGVIDSGLQDTHPDLIDNIWENPAEKAGVAGVDDDGNGYVDDIHGWDFRSEDNTVYDSSRHDAHGTHVAGTIGAQGNNGTGVVGVNWDVSIASGKFIGPRGGSTYDAIEAVEYFTDLKLNRGVNVVATNNSWGGGGYSQGLADAIAAADDANILFIAAAGNDGRDNDVYHTYPAHYGTVEGIDNVIAVAAINPDGNLAGYSNYGDQTVHLAAPGSSIWSTVPGGYSSYNGTSMATPHVTGAAALYASEYAKVNSGALPSAARIKADLLNTVNRTDKTYPTITGGRLNAFDALGQITVDTSGTPADPSDVGGLVTSASSIRVTWADNSNNETGFIVDRSTDGGLTFQNPTTTNANVEYLDVTGLTANTEYVFRVTAQNTLADPDTVSNVVESPTIKTAASVPPDHADPFTEDPFDAGIGVPDDPGTPWTRTADGTWQHDATAGILSQTSTADLIQPIERKAMLVGASSTATEIEAKVRIDTWAPGEFARAGVGLYTDPVTGLGYNLLVADRDADGVKTLSFLDDYQQWSDGYAGAATTVTMDTGAWYRFRMAIDTTNGTTLLGKFWEEGTAEPDWMISFDTANSNSDRAWVRPDGVPALNGGLSGTFNNLASSSTVSFDVVNDSAPTVILSDPGSPLSGTVSLTATADDDNLIEGVVFYHGSTEIGPGTRMTDGSWQVDWDTTTESDGTYTLTAVATDSIGQTTTSPGVSVTVQNGTADTSAPTDVAITDPLDGSTVFSSVPITANATDNVGVETVAFYYDGNFIGNGTLTDGTATSGTWTVSWDTTTVLDSIDTPYTLTAEAFDAAGNSTISAGVAVTVDNPDVVELTVTGVTQEVALPGDPEVPVTVHGTGFIPEGATVSFSGGRGRPPEVTQYDPNSTTESLIISVSVPPNAKTGEWWDVTVTNPDGTSFTLSEGVSRFFVG